RDRDRDRGRGERRAAPVEPVDDIDPFGILPPRGEDRPRDRGEDRPRDRSEDRPRDRGEDRPRDRDRGRERERPDHAVRGRRDRSEPPARRFGEGLADQGEEPEPIRRDVIPSPERYPLWEEPSDRLAAPSEPEPIPSPERRIAEVVDWDREIGWER